MASKLELSIPTTTTAATAKPYTIYHVSVRQPVRSYTLQKRYSDFTALHAAITAQSGNTAPPTPLPQKSWFKSTISSPELTETRRRGLEAYLRAINEAADARWRSSAAWRAFLNLPSAGSSSDAGSRLGQAAAATSTKSADLQAAIVDPAVWLDVHRDLKTQLRDARQHLARREQAVSAQEQHEATGDAKRCLVRSVAFVSALEKGLVAMAAKSGGDGARLADGEIRRRRDLVLGAKKERDALEALLSASRSGKPRSTEPSPLSEDGPAHGGPSFFSSNAAKPSGRRVLGAPPAKETEQTRELDNEGVLQLQRQIMQDQDQDAEDLTKVVHRIRNMGEQMNEELVLQAKMLDMLGEDVERVEGKIDVSKKRLGKIT